jgi:hypothetical protein
MGFTKRWIGDLQDKAANGDEAVQQQLASIGLWTSPEELMEREAAEQYRANEPLPRFSADETEDFPIGFGDTSDRDSGERFDYEELFVCQNCDGEFTEDQLKPVKDLEMRVSPGEIVPAGECPDCGAVCHPKEDDGEDFEPLGLEEFYPLDSSADGEALASAGFGTDEDYGWCGEIDHDLGDDLF